MAIVTGAGSEEIYCDEYGRVKVRFPWDLSGRTDDTSSCWVRVSHPWASVGWGMLAIPRVGHEVIVEFLNGDPDQPVIIGRTYHANNLPPGDLPATKTQMALRSKTHKGDGFNELRFEDLRGGEEIYIHAQQDMNTDVLRDQTTTINRDMTLTVDNNRTSVIKVDDDESIGGYQTLDAAALRFFRKAIRHHGEPEVVTIDKSGANTAALTTLNASKPEEERMTIRQSK